MTMQSEQFSRELLQLYYDRFFPYEPMTNWLMYSGGSEYLSKREFSFTLENDIYIRYKAFRSHEELRLAMLKQLPHKIDIGAVFSISPLDKGKVQSEAFTAEERELVFDIDLTDYDDTRTCCQEGSICLRCWPFMAAAAKVLDRCLREDFGFRHILYVYSGRRGIHIWVADSIARQLTNEARTAIVQYLHVVEGNENCKRKVRLKEPLHPSLYRAFEILKPLFNAYIFSDRGQNVLMDEAGLQKVIEMIPDEGVRAALEKKRSSMSWDEIRQAVEAAVQKEARSNKRSYSATTTNDFQRKKDLQDLEMCLEEIVFSYLYPRLDANVSKQRNHLLKSPFAVHPKTGRVCVPFDIANVETFDPTNVPTLAALQEELNNDVSRHSLQPYIDFFEKSFLRPLKLEEMLIERDEREASAAYTGDW